jgi:hypothetical protein
VKPIKANVRRNNNTFLHGTHEINGLTNLYIFLCRCAVPCDHPPALVHVEWVCLAGGAAEGGVAAAAQGVARLQRGAAAQAQRYSAAPRIGLPGLGCYLYQYLGAVHFYKSVEFAVSISGNSISYHVELAKPFIFC